MFTAAYDRMYELHGTSAKYRVSASDSWADVTVRFKHAGRDAEGTRAIIKVLVSEVADEPPLGAQFEVDGRVWIVLEIEAEGTKAGLQWACVGWYRPAANGRK